MNFYQPTILTDVTPQAKITTEETFGPVAPIYKFKDEKEVIDLANNSPYGLASYFYSRDMEEFGGLQKLLSMEWLV